MPWATQTPGDALVPKVVVSNAMTWDFAHNPAGAWHLWNGQTASLADFRDPAGSLRLRLDNAGFELASTGPPPPSR